MIIFEDQLIPLHSGEASTERMPPWGALPDDDELPTLEPANEELPESLPTLPFPPINPSPNQPKAYCNVRFLYAAIEETAVNVSIGGKICIRNFQYSNVTPYYMETAGPNKVVSLTETHSGKVINQTQLFLQEGYSYTIALINRHHKIDLLVILDAPLKTTDSFASVRTINLTAYRSPLDVFLSGIGRAFRWVDHLEVTPHRNIRPATYRALTSKALPCVSNRGIRIGHTSVAYNNTQMTILDSTVFNVKHNSLYTLYLIGHPYQYPALQILPLESDFVY